MMKTADKKLDYRTIFKGGGGMKQPAWGKVDWLERKIYSEICSHDGIKAKDIGKAVLADRKTINQYLYKAPFMKELCFQDSQMNFWHCHRRNGLKL